jgi:hypothetical protein
VVSFTRQQHRERHALWVAGAGRGKSVSQANISLQLIEPYSENNEIRQDALFVIDHGGEHAWPHLLEEKCNELGRRFQYFHLAPDFHFTFDPLRSLQAIENNHVRRANIVGSGVDLLFEHGYGKSFWSRLSVAHLIDASEHIQAIGEPPGLHAFARALDALRRDRRRSRELSEALLALRPLLHYPQLTDCPGKPTIDIAESIDKGYVTYFNLNTLFDGAAARAVGTLAYWSIVAETAYRTEHRLPVVYTHCMVDEAHNIAGGKPFSDGVCMYRKNNLRLSFAFQSSAQMRQAGMYEILRDNCPIKIHMTISTSPDGDLAELQSHSKDTIRQRRSVVARGMQGGVTMADHVEPGITRDDAIDVSYGPVGDAYLIFNAGEGHQEPIRLRLAFPTSLEKYRRIVTMAHEPQFPSLPDIKVPAPPPISPQAEIRLRLDELGKKLRALESWQLLSPHEA